MPLLWKAPALRGRMKSGRRTVGFQMKGPVPYRAGHRRGQGVVPLCVLPGFSHKLLLHLGLSSSLGPLVMAKVSFFPRIPLSYLFPAGMLQPPSSPDHPSWVYTSIPIGQGHGWGRSRRHWPEGRQADWKVPPSAPLWSCCISSFPNSDRGAGGGVGCLPLEQNRCAGAVR